MTYTVKNGTWCKDNNKEYYSTTKTGLKAALAAGEITSGTKVVIHESQYHTGQLIQSLNPECPEGCFVPHGQTFDTSIYTELAKLFPDGNLPDMRECVMVCAGRSERTEITNHDEYIAGQFKDDQFAEHNHSVSTTVNDPGHSHGITDPGHGHTVLIDIAEDSAGAGAAVNGKRGAVSPLEQYTALASPTHISINSAATGIAVNTTEEKAGAADKVTHGKQFGVYYYIAF